jgi:hypothetical protein
VTVVSNVLAALQTAPPWLVYLLVGALVFGKASLAILLAVGAVAAIAGDSVGYEIERLGGIVAGVHVWAGGSANRAEGGPKGSSPGAGR